MRYELHLVRKADAAGGLRAAYERPSDAERRPPTAAEEEALRGLAADLQAADPALDLREPDDGFLLQLGYESERPLAIDIAGVGEITMSWSYGAAGAAPEPDEVERYLRVFVQHGYVAYDPERERAFEGAGDADEAAEIHRRIEEQLHEALRADLRAARPWWKGLTGGR